MNTDSLRHLLALAETGSFSEAAARTGVSQPAVSLAVKKMEGDLGVKLFERSGNRYVTTEAGQVFVEHASGIVEAETRLLSSIEISRQARAGKLSVATSNIPGEYVLPLILGDFRKSRPDIEPLMQVMDSSGVIEVVREGAFELGFAGSSVVPKDLEATPFCPDILVVICAPSHPLADRRSVKPGQLAGEPVVLRERGSATRDLMIGALKHAGLGTESLRVEMELGSTGAVISAVESGAGISLVSAWAARGPLAEGKIRSINMPSLEARRQFSFVQRKAGRLTPPATAFREFVLGKRGFLRKRAGEIVRVSGPRKG